MTKKLIQLTAAIIITLTLTHFSSAHAQTASNQCNNTSVDSTCIAPNPQSYTPVDTCNNPYACGTSSTTTTPTTTTPPTGGSSLRRNVTEVMLNWGCGGRYLANGTRICTLGFSYNVTISYTNPFAESVASYASTTEEGSADNTLPNCNIGLVYYMFHTSDVNTTQCQSLGELFSQYLQPNINHDTCYAAGINTGGSIGGSNCEALGRTYDLQTVSGYQDNILPLIKNILPNDSLVQHITYDSSTQSYYTY